MANNYCDCRQGRDPCTCKATLAEPAPSTNALLNQVEKAQAEMAEWPKAWRDSEGLEPVPPAGRDRLPERPYASEDDQSTMTDYEIGLGHGGCEMWDKFQPHVTRLQAEVAHLRQHKNDYMEAAEETAKALQAELSQKSAAFEVAKGMLQHRVKQCTALQSELTKALKHFETAMQDNKNQHAELTTARELLVEMREAMRQYEKDCDEYPPFHHNRMIERADAFIAHQSAPAAKESK